MLIERHDNESTSIWRDPNGGRKQWEFSCECGEWSSHSSENAAQRARRKHMHDEQIFLAQNARADELVDKAQDALYRAIRDRVEAHDAYTHMLENRSK